jgi:hypothetical protein
LVACRTLRRIHCREDAERPTAEQDVSFENLFGVSRAQLKEQGVDEDKYVLAHISQAMEKNGPASFRLRHRYFTWRIRTLGALIVLGAFAALIGGATGPLKAHQTARLTVIIFCAATMAVVLASDLRARHRYRRAMRDEATAEEENGLATANRGEFVSTSATLGRGRFAISIPVSYLAGVSVHKGTLTLKGSRGNVLAEVDVSSVQIDSPRIFMGAGVKLDLGSAGHWVIGFSHPYGLLDDARSDTRHFVQAVRDAQIGWR